MSRIVETRFRSQRLRQEDGKKTNYLVSDQLRSGFSGVQLKLDSTPRDLIAIVILPRGKGIFFRNAQTITSLVEISKGGINLKQQEVKRDFLEKGLGDCRLTGIDSFAGPASAPDCDIFNYTFNLPNDDGIVNGKLNFVVNRRLERIEGSITTGQENRVVVPIPTVARIARLWTFVPPEGLQTFDQDLRTVNN